MKIKQILEEVDGIYYSNGPVNGVGWINSLRLDAQEKRLKTIIKNKIIQVLQKREEFSSSWAEQLAEEMVNDL